MLLKSGLFSHFSVDWLEIPIWDETRNWVRDWDRPQKRGNFARPNTILTRLGAMERGLKVLYGNISGVIFYIIHLLCSYDTIPLTQ